MDALAQTDSKVFDIIRDEERRQLDTIELIASENFTSAAVMQAVGTVLTNKYAEGLPGKRYYGGCEFVDQVENLAIERAQALFGANTSTFSHTPERPRTSQSSQPSSNRETES